MEPAIIKLGAFCPVITTWLPIGPRVFTISITTKPTGRAEQRWCRYPRVLHIRTLASDCITTGLFPFPLFANSDGAGIPGVHVNVYDGSWNLVTSFDTDSSGTYYGEGVVPGTYYLKTSGTVGYIDEYYHDALSQSTATAIHIYNDPLNDIYSKSLILSETAPVLADFDDDWISDLTVWRQGTWFTLLSASPNDYGSTSWGLASDIPVLGDYDGDGEADIAVWRPDSGLVYHSQRLTGNLYRNQLGLADGYACSRGL